MANQGARMKAFTQGITKQEFLKEIYWHRDQDAFIKGTYAEGEGKNFQGCAVGCSLNSVARIKGIEISTSSHKEYETHLGIPQWVARLEDRIFEGLPKERSKRWPVEFAEAVNEGADLEKIKIPMLIFIVEQARTKTTNERSLKAIDGVLTELRKDALDLTQLREARSAAYAAAAAAYAAADADAADAAARSNAYVVFADKLLELMRNCH